MSNTAEKLLASVIEGDGADVPVAPDELGRITLPLAASVSDADAQAIAGYAHIIGAAAGILVDGHTTIIDKELARDLIRTCKSGIDAIVEKGDDEEQTT